jgi:hypothetical protein
VGDTPDVSDLLDFRYYDWVWYWDPTSARFPADTRKLGRWLGRNHAHGPAMCYKVLKSNGHFIVRSSCTPLDNLKKDVDNIIEKLDSSYILEEDTADVEVFPPLDEYDKESNLPPLDVDYEEIMDPLINAEIILPQGNFIALASEIEPRMVHQFDIRTKSHCWIHEFTLSSFLMVK